MKFLTIILAAIMGVLPAGKAFLEPLQQRDSLLVADQIKYGFRLDSVKAGTGLSLQDLSKASNDTLSLVRGWQIDTLKTFRMSRKDKTPYYNLQGSIILAPFEEGHYSLPPIAVLRTFDGGKVDTLLFEAAQMDVKTMPVDTASFKLHDIKGQMAYPLTFAEVFPWAAGAWLLITLSILAVCLVKVGRQRRSGAIARHKDPPYIVALRELDKYRGDKYWAPEKQKSFYSGITDILKSYMEDRFGVDAPEMTTAELFDALKGHKDITPELYAETKSLFECSDFVKFAKHTAAEEDNAKALPTAVRFVTSTYHTELEEEQKTDVL